MYVGQEKEEENTELERLGWLSENGLDVWVRKAGMAESERLEWQGPKGWMAVSKRLNEKGWYGWARKAGMAEFERLVFLISGRQLKAGE